MYLPRAPREFLGRKDARLLMFAGLSVILPAMLRLGTQSKALLLLLCIFMVTMRVGGAHLHLCFDGSEPPTTLHMANDIGFHHPNDRSHSDVDVSVADDTLVKKADLSFDSPTLIAALFLVASFLPFVAASRPRFDSFLPVFAHRAHLRPLLRGPPL